MSRTPDRFQGETSQNCNIYVDNCVNYTLTYMLHNFKMHPNIIVCLVQYKQYFELIIRSANFKKEVKNDPLAYATHGILKPHRENVGFDSNQQVDLTNYVWHFIPCFV